MPTAVLADIIASRGLADREAAQTEIETAVSRVQEAFPRAVQPLASTVGDEFQGLYRSVTDALCAILLIQLSLSDAVECRFGVGIGDVRTIGSSTGAVPEGPGWWAARAAVERVHVDQQRRVTSSRIRVVAHDAPDDVFVDGMNAYLLARDALVVSMTERARRLTLGRCLGRTQAALAAEEGITQSAVSQALTTAGSAAVAAGFALLAETRA